MTRAGDLYESDFFSWTLEQARLLRLGRLDSVDLENIAEEIETLGRAELNALRSRYAVLGMHLIKTALQPKRASRSWALTIAEQRIQIARLLDDNPGLKPRRSTLFLEGYQDGRKLAAADTGLDLSRIPAELSFSMAQAEDEAWHPTGAGDEAPLA